MDVDDDEFGLDSAKLAAFISTLGIPYQIYEQNILEKGLFGALLLDRVDDVEHFARALSKVGIVEVNISIVVNCYYGKLLKKCRHFPNTGTGVSH